MMKDTKISRKPSTLRTKAAALALVALTGAALPVAPAFAGGRGHGYGHGGGWDWDGGHRGHGGYGGGYRHHGGHHGHHDGAAIAVAAGVGLLLGAALLSQPRPAYYTPPPRVVYAPPPAYYAQRAPIVAEPTSDVYRSRSGEYCREYQSTIRVGGRLERGYGTACLGEDGAWRVVD